MSMLHNRKRLIPTHKGQGILEFGLIALLVGVAVIGATQTLRPNFEDHMASVAMLENTGVETTASTFKMANPNAGSNGAPPTFNVGIGNNGNVEYTAPDGSPYAGNPFAAPAYTPPGPQGTS